MCGGRRQVTGEPYIYSRCDNMGYFQWPIVLQAAVETGGEYITGSFDPVGVAPGPEAGAWFGYGPAVMVACLLCSIQLMVDP